MKTIFKKGCYIKLLVLVMGWINFHPLRAQQEPHYTQYMFNTLAVNPAYAGSKDAVSLTGLYRLQWVGIHGAPATQTFSVHGPYYRYHMGWGVHVINDALGPVHQTMVFGDYSYRLDMNNGSRLQFGLSAGFEYFQLSIEDEKRLDEIDPYVFDVSGKFLPNVGVGLYYFNEKGYIGLSVPKIITLKLQNKDVEAGKINRHWFLMGGYVFDLDYYGDTKFKPSFMVKAVRGAPLSVDVSGILYFYKRFGVGLAYRVGDSFSGILQFYFSPNFHMGYSYDYTLTPLRHYNNGSHELYLTYDFPLKSPQIIYSPRFF